ncbi:MAG: hypothetical protein GQF41_0226 [Candidatus Rifleibacterium amylolyticum]|nr:MAG: hypothetical protein GQF41_0226 [Candidatus Rifleibacterium amylolyticum]
MRRRLAFSPRLAQELAFVFSKPSLRSSQACEEANRLCA